HMFEINGIGRPSSSWPVRALTMKSKKPISIVTCSNVTHLVHGGFSNDSEIWWTERSGSHWNADVRVPNQASEGGAALGCLGRPVMVHNGGYSQLWWSYFGL